MTPLLSRFFAELPTCRHNGTGGQFQGEKVIIECEFQYSTTADWRPIFEWKGLEAFSQDGPGAFQQNGYSS